MATHVSLHNQHFWTPSTHTRVNPPGSERLFAQQQESSSPEPSSRSSGHVPDDEIAETDDIISISSDEGSDVEDDSHDDQSQKRVTHVSNRSTPASIASHGSKRPVCQKSPSMSTCGEATGAEDSQEASADTVCLERTTATAHASPSPGPMSVLGEADADCEQPPASASSGQPLFTSRHYTPTRQVEKTPAHAYLSPGLLLGNGDRIYASDGVVPMATDLANIADKLQHAQPSDTPPLVEASAASAQGQIGDKDGVAKHNRRSNRDNNHGVGVSSSLSEPAYQEACRSPSPASAESTASSLDSPFHSPPTPGSSPASTPGVSPRVIMSLKRSSYDLEPMKIISSPLATDDSINTLRDPSQVQSQLLDGSEVKPNTHVQIDDKNMEVRSSPSPTRQRFRPTTLSEESQWRDRNDSHEQDGVNRQTDTEYCPSSTDDENEDDYYHDSAEDEGFQQDSRKRRKFGLSSVRPRSPSKRNCPDTSIRANRPRDMFPSVMSPPSTDDVDGVRAEFDEWALQNVRLKRTIVNDRATFQLQFDWDLCMKHGHIVHQGSKRGHKRGHSARARFTQEEDTLLIKLKEERELSWADIHARFSDRFGWRSKEALQVRYCTKLKCRG
ncbi:Myb-like DNA-binding domain protein [Metarhizium robertsii]|uniref:Myb-like DNA-binding domain protein n=1 Tax=Metarhizium robertsii TaxID=568076 RepID=A0A014MTM5_9HYPO|nr:Myb-like DNA-binding domain protein [Metarhizium robertsii]